MQQLRFVLIAFLTSLFIINATLLRKTLAVLLCGVLSFNLVSGYSFLNQIGAVNAQTAPPAKNLDLNGIWITRNPKFGISKKGCTFLAGEYAVPASEVTLTQKGNQLTVPNGSTAQHKGTVSGNVFTMLNVATLSFGTFTSEYTGSISNDGNKITGEASCTAGAGTATARGSFTWTRKSPLSLNQKILSSIKKLGKFPTKNIPGTKNGRKACVAAVNEVLKNAGIEPLDHRSVLEAKAALDNGRGTPVNASDAEPGDIVLVDIYGQHHIGFCLNNGCSQTISNSSSNGSFSFTGNGNFSYKGSPYNGSTPHIYKFNP